MTSGSSPLRILLVEDDTMSRKLITKVIERLHYHVQVAENGQVALEICEGYVFDVILMDVNMPVMDGLTATRHLRRMLPKGQQPYIIALTGAAFDEEKQACLDAGMDTFVGKPVRPNELRALLEQFQEQRSQATPLIDRKALEELRAYNTDGQDMVPILVGMFLEEAPRQVSDLKDAFAAADAARVRHIAHSLKSSAATLGATKLAQTFAELEKRAREDDLADINNLDAMLAGVLTDSMDALNKVLIQASQTS
jgi:CheY-like chemotaxis protein/HPt (histidine-containing phosphotransfer) domain-containing protein